MQSLRPGLRTARLSIIALALLSLGPAVSGCGRKEDPNNPIVARIGDSQIRKWDFVSAVEKAPRDTWPPLDSLDHAGRVEFLKTMISKRLIEMEAQRRYPSLPPQQEYLVRKHERDLGFAMLASERAPARRLSAEDLGECRRILIPTYSAYTLVLDDEARAREVAASEWTNDAFNDLVRTETLELTVKETLGSSFLRDIRATQFVPEALPALENVQPGALLGPYRMQAGWVIYRIASVTIPPDSVQADTTGLADACRSLRRSVAFKKVVDEVLAKEPITYNDENIEWLQARYAEKLAAAHDSLEREILRYKEVLIPALDEAGRARELARVAGRPYTAGDFLAELAPHPINDYPNILHRGSIRLMVEQFLTDAVLWGEVEKHGYAKRPEIVDAVARKRAEIGFHYLLDSELYDQALATVTEDELQHYYDENTHLFMSRGKVELELIYLDDFWLGTRLTTRLKRGESFEKVAADARKADPSAEAVRSTGRFDQETQPELYGFASAFEVGGASGPVRMQNGRLVIYRLLYKGPPEPMPLATVRELVKRDVVFMKREKLLDELITRLHADHQVQIDEAKL